MRKGAFDQFIEGRYEKFRRYFVSRFRDQADDAYHMCLLYLYSQKVYRKLTTKGGKLEHWLRRTLFLKMDSAAKVFHTYGGRMENMDTCDEPLVEEPTELCIDVRTAIGKLSYEHQQMIRAVYWDGATLRELANRMNVSYYHVFTEFEIAKSCLKELLNDYHPRAWNR